ncbi:Transmembrane protein 19 [Seminavis robusta]|uniref:Transmembrane protein 19 n=1 Tax=Seminavis robusta TaxID=568900 RepID=A0A9N8HKG2_9STRA|nr:Transmembrane protein 19 [Seminavis robusta]|eukprot:Sro730_g193970.1 Transmembrane protein 19 (297) ;mRNA; f:11778-12668
MDPFGVVTTPMAIAITLALAIRAHRKKNLTPSGAVAGSAVGFLIVGTGLRGMVLFFFYQIGSMATKYNKLAKEQKDATLAGHAARGVPQVLAVSITPVALSLMHALWCGAEQPIVFHHDNDNNNLAASLTCGILAHHATCLADTLASELGILSKTTPILITNPWRRVPAGTNGGITVLGTFWSLAGGAVIGLLTVLMDFLSGIFVPSNVLPMILLGAVSGVVGSLADSLLGATLQSSYYDSDKKMTYHANSEDLPATAELLSGINLLTNEQVNFVSSLITTAIGGWVLGPLVFALT